MNDSRSTLEKVTNLELGQKIEFESSAAHKKRASAWTDFLQINIFTLDSARFQSVSSSRFFLNVANTTQLVSQAEISAAVDKCT